MWESINSTSLVTTQNMIADKWSTMYEKMKGRYESLQMGDVFTTA